MILITVYSTRYGRKLLASDHEQSAKYCRDMAYAEGLDPPHYPVPAIIYGFNESWDCWEYIGQPDDIRSSYPTYYKRTGWPNG